MSVTRNKQDAAFAEIAREIRDMIYRLNGHPGSNTQPQANVANKQQRERTKRGTEKLTMVSPSETPILPPASSASLSATTLKKALDRYYRELQEYQGKADYELAVRSAFQNLLAETARMVKWTLIPEQTIEGGLRPDGVLRDAFDLRRGYWEAKGPKSDLAKEIARKKADGYPLVNTIFENTKKAILYQNKQPYAVEFDLSKPKDVSDLLQLFFHYTEPDIEHFENSLQEFKERIPEHAQALLKIIAGEHKLNKKFIAAFQQFTELCQASLDPKINAATINEMLVQHLLTERLFRTVFDNPDFVSRNVIASEIEKVIQALTRRSFNRANFFKELDRFYFSIEAAAKHIESWSERQHFLNVVYERFFQGFAVKQADTHGIVYTPQEIVDFMCESVNEVLKKEFGTSIDEPGVQILDPATGTGSFIVNLVHHHIKGHKLKYKYQHDLFCNEIMLLPYYIASLNIEHEYYVKMGEYEPFEGICFADTLELAEGQQLSLFVEENTERVKREKEAQIMVVIGNPPYNVGQINENDNNKNRGYKVLDDHINKTYVKDSHATNKNKLYDAYVRFFRWATDRLGDRDGIICFVSNNSFLDQIAFDGMRMHLLQDFTQIYHLDLHGNVRKNPKLSGTTHNIFGIQVGVGITLAVRNSKLPEKKLYYYRVPEYWTRADKLAFLAKKESMKRIEWVQLQPDKRQTWITEGLKPEFETYLPLGSKEARAVRHGATTEQKVTTLFKTYSLGPRTNRDDWVYNFSRDALIQTVKRFVEIYNTEVDRWRRRGSDDTTVDDFVTYDDTKINWRVEKMKLTPDKTAVIVNESLTLAGIPQECFAYRLGNRSALEWVIDQYQVSKDQRSGLESDPNRLDDEQYIVRLVEKVITVSVETVKLVDALAQTVTIEDWAGEGGSV